MPSPLMVRYLGRRLVGLLVTVWVIASLVFVMIKLIPGDEAASAAGPTSTPEQVEAVRERLGLDHSLLVQYVDFLGRLLHGDLGTSIQSFRPVTDDLIDRLPATIELVLAASVINIVGGITLGILAASRPQSRRDTRIRLLAIVCGALPIFWIALLAQNFFGARLAVLPVSGIAPPGVDAGTVTGFPVLDALLTGGPVAAWDAAQYLVLPAICLSLPFIAFSSRLVRATMISTLAAEHVTAAVAKGASPWRITVRHGLRVSISPISTLIGLQMGWMLGAAVLVEDVFARPGLGSYLTDAVAAKDTFAVLGSVLFIGFVVVVLTLLVDLLQIRLDPRVRAQQLGVAA